MISAFKNIFDSVASLRSEVNNLRNSIEKKKQEREKLLTQPLSRKELGSKLCGMIDNQADVYIKRLSLAIAGFRNKPFYNFDESHLDIISTIGGSSLPDSIPKQNLAWFLGNLMKERIQDAVDVMDWPNEVGPPLSERKLRVEVLDKEIALLEAKELEFADQVNRAGIRID